MRLVIEDASRLLRTVAQLHERGHGRPRRDERRVRPGGRDWERKSLSTGHDDHPCGGRFHLTGELQGSKPHARIASRRDSRSQRLRVPLVASNPSLLGHIPCRVGKITSHAGTASGKGSAHRSRQESPFLGRRVPARHASLARMRRLFGQRPSRRPGARRGPQHAAQAQDGLTRPGGRPASGAAGRRCRLGDSEGVVSERTIARRVRRGHEEVPVARSIRLRPCRGRGIDAAAGDARIAARRAP